jgi:hypothetical protein
MESKLAEVIGLAQASQDTIRKVVKLTEHDKLRATLEKMAEEAKETADRGIKVAEQLDGKKTALLDKARETKSEAAEMRDAYLGDDADALDGLEFMIMAEAGELGHVEIVDKMNETAKDPQIGEVATFALEVQRRHWDQVRQCALMLAAEEDPNEVEE